MKEYDRNFPWAGASDKRPIEIFFSYSHKDEQFLDELIKHLSILQRQGVIAGWNDREIHAGVEWIKEINTHLNRAHIILLLISPDFMASDYCYGIEVAHAMERHHAGEARVIPIILRPVDWREASFGKIQALPKNGKPVTTWGNADEAFADIAKGIKEAIKRLPAPKHKGGEVEHDIAVTLDQIALQSQAVHLVSKRQRPRKKFVMIAGAIFQLLPYALLYVASSRFTIIDYYMHIAIISLTVFLLSALVYRATYRRVSQSTFFTLVALHVMISAVLVVWKPWCGSGISTQLMVKNTHQLLPISWDKGNAWVRAPLNTELVVSAYKSFLLLKGAYWYGCEWFIGPGREQRDGCSFTISTGSISQAYPLRLILTRPSCSTSGERPLTLFIGEIP